MNYKLAKEMDAAHKRGEAVEQVLCDETLKLIAHELTKSIKENMSIDWNLRESARAKMRITVRRLLKK